MIRLEGYKAFRGTMRITPTIPDKEPFELTGDWLYKPEDKCWYGLCRSFPENICTVVIDLTCAPSLLNVSRPWGQRHRDCKTHQREYRYSLGEMPLLRQRGNSLRKIPDQSGRALALLVQWMYRLYRPWLCAGSMDSPGNVEP